MGDSLVARLNLRHVTQISCDLQSDRTPQRLRASTVQIYFPSRFIFVARQDVMLFCAERYYNDAFFRNQTISQQSAHVS
jgi:hypothetical protein